MRQICQLQDLGARGYSFLNTAARLVCRLNIDYIAHRPHYARLRTCGGVRGVLLFKQHKGRAGQGTPLLVQGSKVSFKYRKITAITA